MKYSIYFPSCGYCGSKEDTSISHGMWAHRLTCEDYQDLIDRGWRRSGKYCYKPVLDRTCCPQYTIRCKAIEFRISKSQKTVLKRMNDFLLRDKRREGSSAEESAKVQATSSSSCGESETKPVQPTATSVPSSEDSTASKSTEKAVTPGSGPDPNKPPCRKAKELRRMRKQQKLAAKAPAEAERTEPSPDKHSNPTTARPNPTREDKDGRVTGKDSSSVSSTSFLEVGPDGKKPLEMFLSLAASDKPPAHKLEMKLVRSSPPSAEFQATFRDSYSLYRKYQMAVHHDTEDKCSEKTFRRFLCDSPLVPTKGEAGWPCDYGSYHQHYYVDGKLIMVGVVDILPKCLSSVYVFYDPDYSFITPGVYSALRELELTRKMYLQCQTFEYYYMGYYIHSCQKMRYKGGYFPSCLLCPESYRFVPIEPCKPKLDVSKYTRLNDAPTEPEAVERWLNSTMVLFEQQGMPYQIFRAICGDRQDPKVKEYASLVGPKVASRMLLFLG